MQSSFQLRFITITAFSLLALKAQLYLKGLGKNMLEAKFLAFRAESCNKLELVKGGNAVANMLKNT